MLNGAITQPLSPNRITMQGVSYTRTAHQREELTRLQSCMMDLRHKSDWQSVDDVNHLMDEMLSILAGLIDDSREINEGWR